VAAELFDLLGDGGVELIMGSIERRPAMNAALRRRISSLRDTFAGKDDDDGGGGGKLSGGSGAPGPTVTITSTTDQKLEKLRRKEGRKVGRRIAQGQGEPLLEWLAASGVGFAAICEGDWERAAADEKAAAASSEEDLWAGLRGLGSGAGGGRRALPTGTVRKVHKTYEEVTVPAATRAPVGANERFVAVDELDEWAQLAFDGMTALNRIQSRIYDAAYNSHENLLVCAPTGAGKTNIAMLAVLHEIGQHLENGVLQNREDFKIVYVAPMKALAAEVTGAFARRLDPLGISVRELTGDTQLSKRELEQTQMIVTTPEKWDVITRKGGEV
jgi:activating signal cointegrator complex subunit 3